jgi:K+-sensing histidine kinase KdpD
MCRALRNISENAQRSGAEAHVSFQDRRRARPDVDADYGPGIPIAELQQMFEIYFRLE